MQLNEELFFREYLTSEQYQDCVQAQAKSSQAKSIFIIAIEKGYINDKNIAEILKKIPQHQKPQKPKSSPAKKEITPFGQICIENGFATKDQIEECLEIQRKLKKEDKHFRIGQILTNKKYITNRQAKIALEQQGKKILRCVPCDAKFNIRNYKANKKYYCPKCNEEISASTTTQNSIVANLGVEGSFISKESSEEVDDESLSLLHKKVGDYEIVSFLGSGGMADVYKVVNSFRKRPRALKIMKAQAGIDRFTKEFERAHALRHPNIVRVFEIGNFEGRPYFFMEYMDGGSLDRRIEKMGVLPLLEGLSIVKQTAIALKYAHENNIVHRDIKPSNILLSKNNHEISAKVTDFGIAKTVNDSQVTVTGHLVGTFKYMAPEHIKGGALDGKSDIFSLGIMCHEIFTGREPFDVDDPVGYLFVNIKETPPSIHTVNPDLPKELSLVVDKMLSKDPKHRYTASTLLLDINRLIDFVGKGIAISGVEEPDSVFYEKGTFVALKQFIGKITQRFTIKEEEIAEIVEADIEDNSWDFSDESFDYSQFPSLGETEELGKDDTARQQYELALALAKKGNWDGAVRNLQALIDVFPGSPWSAKANKAIKSINAKFKKLEEKRSSSATSQKKK